MKIILLFFLIFPQLSFAQLRVNEKLPTKVSATKSLGSFKCWVKSSIGQWQQKAALDNIDSKVLKFEISKVRYEDKDYNCFVKHSRSPYYNKRTHKSGFMYTTSYYVFEPIPTNQNNSDFQRLSFKLFLTGTVIKVDKPIDWDQILIDLKETHKASGETDNLQFLVISKQYEKENVTQFIFGGYDPSNNLYTTEFFVCDPKDIEILNCSYYECSTNLLRDFLKMDN